MPVWRHGEKGLEDLAKNVDCVSRTNNFSKAEHFFKTESCKKPNYNEIDQSRAVLRETRIGPDPCPLATSPHLGTAGVPSLPLGTLFEKQCHGQWVIMEHHWT